MVPAAPESRLRPRIFAIVTILVSLACLGWALHGVNFELRRGEILGIGGLLGSGRTEILESIFGVARGWRGGELAIDGATVDIKSPADAYRLGIALVTEDRKERGLHLDASICDNVALPSIGAMSRFGLRAFARDIRRPAPWDDEVNDCSLPSPRTM